MLLQLVLLEQGPQHVLVVLDCRAAAASVAVGVALGFQLLVPVLLPHSRLFPLEFQLLIALLFDHVVCPLVQAHAPLLRLYLVLDQAGEPLRVRSRSARGGRTDAGHRVVLLAELLNLGVVAAPADGRLITAVHRSLPVPVLPILLVLLVVRVLLLHSEVVLLLHERGLVAVQVTDFFLRGVGLLVSVDGRGRVLGYVVHWANWAVQLGGEPPVLDLRLACDCVVVLLVAAAPDVVVWKQAVLLLLSSLINPIHLASTLSTILLLLLLLLLVLIF